MHFDKAFATVLKYEGGYSDHVADTGGKTKYGITEATARANGYNGDMKELPLEFAKEVYRKSYWANHNYDKIKDQNVAVEMFDQAVNMGAGTANRHLQQALNLLTDANLKVDGVVGIMTIGAVNKYQHQKSLFNLLNALQAKRYIEICEQNPSQKTFIRGWVNRVEIIK